MSTKAQHPVQSIASHPIALPTGRLVSHALVIGASIAGLTAARILLDYADHVTIIERDPHPDPSGFRRGTPQSRHAHTLLPQGQQILEDLFPGLLDELVASGATAYEASEMAFFYKGQWRHPPAGRKKKSVAASRPLLEATLYRQLIGNGRLTVEHGSRVLGLQSDESGRQVTGIRLQAGRRGGGDGLLRAELVVDASGRSSHAPAWLAALGYPPPSEWKIDALTGYASRIYRPPANFAEPWKALYVRPTPPEGTRGALILPLEDGNWFVTLVGVAGDYPPTDAAEFLEFARHLPTSKVYEVMETAEPVTAPLGFRRTTNRVRRYDKLPRYLEGFLVLGDAAYALNPIYAQGMTAAVVGSQALAATLAAQPAANGLMGLAQAFQVDLSQAVTRLWHTATTTDWLWPVTTITDDEDGRRSISS